MISCDQFAAKFSHMGLDPGISDRQRCTMRGKRATCIYPTEVVILDNKLLLIDIVFIVISTISFVHILMFMEILNVLFVQLLMTLM